MKKSLRIVLTVILAVCLLITIAGCGQQSVTTDEEVSTLDKIKESGKLVMGTNAEFEPFEYHEVVDGQPQIVGFDIDVCKIIADKLGVELVIEDMDFDG
ncbi:MAG TPA: transporter substrate-binding domain-containing protein, partial [Clostridiales bacterium]|nr:transporter substrate-binding domain-containing protein [Clostridiales bacterium]